MHWLCLLSAFWLSPSLPVDVAYKYIHIREVANRNFNDSIFVTKLVQRGWRKGQNWCAYFIWIVLDESKNKISIRGGLAQRYITRKSIPARRVLIGEKIFPHSLIIWKRGNSIFGHIGFVVSQIDRQTFHTIEGNTNNGVHQKIRKIEPLAYFRITHFTVTQ